MDDARALRARIRAAAWFSIALAPALGCDRPHDGNMPLGPPTRSMPTCPSGKWCGPRSVALGLSPDADAGGACPQQITWGNHPDAGPRPEGLPPYGDGQLQSPSEAGPDVCCYSWWQPCPGGRPLLDGARPVLATVVGRADWCAATAPAPLAVNGALAEAWLADAFAEHASVASFARAALELLAAGAPARLVAGCQRAAADEVRHAELCFGLASRYAGAPRGPGPLRSPPLRHGGLSALAYSTFVEGCAAETIAALAVLRAAEGCADPAVRAVLDEIAADEARHAALAWSTVAWALSTGGDPVASAIRRARADVRPRAPAASLVASVDAAELAARGRLDPFAQELALRDAWTLVIDPLADDLLGGVRAGHCLDGTRA